MFLHLTQTIHKFDQIVEWSIHDAITFILVRNVSCKKTMELTMGLPTGNGKQNKAHLEISKFLGGQHRF